MEKELRSKITLSANLEKKIIGNTGLEVTTIGMGGAPLGNLDEKTARKTLEKSYELGSITLTQLPYMALVTVKSIMVDFYLK